MYKGILGDCFLIKLASGGRATRILIDCGVLQGIPGAQERMQKVALDVLALIIFPALATHPIFFLIRIG
jgi:hypothetical protein